MLITNLASAVQWKNSLAKAGQQTHTMAVVSHRQMHMQKQTILLGSFSNIQNYTHLTLKLLTSHRDTTFTIVCVCTLNSAVICECSINIKKTHNHHTRATNSLLLASDEQERVILPTEAAALMRGTFVKWENVPCHLLGGAVSSVSKCLVRTLSSCDWWEEVPRDGRLIRTWSC